MTPSATGEPGTAPRISAIIPAYNAAPFIRRSIDSALAQTLPPCEVIVVDDGSADATAEIASAYGPPVRVIRQANAGPGAARNRGVCASSGEWLAMLDADDLWLPNKLERQAALTQDSGVGVVHSTTAGPDTVPDRITFEHLWKRNRIANSSALIRRAAWDQVGGCDEDPAIIVVEDYNLWIRIAAAGWSIVCCREELVVYMSEPGHLMSKYERFSRAEIANVERLGKQLNLEPAHVAEKLLATLDEQGRRLMYYRCMEPAREILSRSYRLRPTPSRLAWWACAHVPRPLLDIRRALTWKSIEPWVEGEAGRERYGKRPIP